MSYACSVLADSVGPHGHRLTTFEITFPRMVLCDLTRHRVASYSFESTRAVPVAKRIEMVRENPYVPTFRRVAKGMGGGEPLSEAEQDRAQTLWRAEARHAADTAEAMIDYGKEHVGRILEPYSWITGIMSATTWDNFFNLRCPPSGEMPDPRFDAQVELQTIAYMMRSWYGTSIPRQLKYGEWHLPLFYVRDALEAWDDATDPLYPAKISAGRCAAVSYLRHHVGDSSNAAAGRWNVRLAPSAHWSPSEHPAQCVPHNPFEKFDTGNFSGFKQLRKFYSGEAVYEPGE